MILTLLWRWLHDLWAARHPALEAPEALLKDDRPTLAE
jgi:hypothetical protein